jgi:hypothetical protein
MSAVTVTVQGRVVPLVVPPLVFRLSCSEYSSRMPTTASPPMIHRFVFVIAATRSLPTV